MSVDIRWQAINQILWKPLTHGWHAQPKKTHSFCCGKANIARIIMPQCYNVDAKSIASETVVARGWNPLRIEQGQMRFNGMHATFNGRNVNLKVFASA